MSADQGGRLGQHPLQAMLLPRLCEVRPACSLVPPQGLCSRSRCVLCLMSLIFRGWFLGITQALP